jgi:hypothetical protein
VGDDELGMVNACLAAEYDIRERAYAALGGLLAYANLEEGNWTSG